MMLTMESWGGAMNQDADGRETKVEETVDNGKVETKEGVQVQGVKRIR